MDVRIYRLSRGWRILAVLFGVCGVALGATGLYVTLDPGPSFEYVHAWPLLLLAIFEIAMALAFSVGLLTTRVELAPDRIEIYAHLFSRKLLRRCLLKTDIGAKKFVPLYGGAYYLYPRSRHQRRLAVSLNCVDEQIFRAWIDGIPNVSRSFLQGR